MRSRLTTHLRAETDNPTFADAWRRQCRTAEVILKRLDDQEGVILADQVGTGKTFVALAVAASMVLGRADESQVVILVPPRVAQKWVEEASAFSSSLVTGAELRCVDQPIRSGEAFLKALDDPPGQQDHIIVVTYEALTTTLKDKFIVLALLYFAVQNRHGAADIRRRIARWSEGRQGIITDATFTEQRVAALLATPPADWRAKWHELTGDDLGDDPVPHQLIRAARDLDLQAVWETTLDLPQKSSANLAARLRIVREALNDSMQNVWKELLTVTPVQLPLLIVDEAHALKNPGTRRSKLLGARSHGSPDGALSEIFDRILLLTATPFELDDRELINILNRLGAVRAPTAAEPLATRLSSLGDRLISARIAAITFETAWSSIKTEDLVTFDNWVAESTPPDDAPARVKEAWLTANSAARTRQDLRSELGRWVIRHERDHRRAYRPGAQTIPGSTDSGGIEISEELQLPFLLAARAQALGERTRSGAAQPHFAYGIASSFETFLRLDQKARDHDDEADAAEPTTPATTNAPDWYLREITSALDTSEARRQHPKIAATVARAVELWQAGDKCLVFCWFIRTTSALQQAIQEQIRRTVQDRARTAFSGDAADAMKELERASDRLLSSDRESGKRVHLAIYKRLLPTSGDDPMLAEELTKAAIRNIRRPENLVRYTDLHDLTTESLLAGINGANPTGVSLLDRWCEFAERTAQLPVEKRMRLMEHLTGDLDEAGVGHEGRGASLSPVRRATGQQERGDRERLIAMFNTPFAPDVLVASSVMGEGIDLHQECRHVIHHDLDWNPSKLEQRTGRLDRVGSLAERVNENIVVYEPYLAGTHDEKMYRVVKDRAAWFDIVMGGKVVDDERATDQVEERVALHPRIAAALHLDLSCA